MTAGQEESAGGPAKQSAGDPALLPDIVDVTVADHVRIRWLLAIADAALEPAAAAGDVRRRSWDVLVAFIGPRLEAAEEICYLPLSRVSPGSATVARQTRQADSDIRDPQD